MAIPVIALAVKRLKSSPKSTIYKADLGVIGAATNRARHDTEVGYRTQSAQEKLGSLNILSD